MSIDIGKTVGQLTDDETAEMAKTCLLVCDDATAVQVIVEYVCGDRNLRNEIVAELEKI